MDQAGAAPAPSFLRHGGLLPAKKGNGADACLAQEGSGGQTSLAGELIWGEATFTLAAVVLVAAKGLRWPSVRSEPGRDRLLGGWQGGPWV